MKEHLKDWLFAMLILLITSCGQGGTGDFQTSIIRATSDNPSIEIVPLDTINYIYSDIEHLKRHLPDSVREQNPDATCFWTIDWTTGVERHAFHFVLNDEKCAGHELFHGLGYEGVIFADEHLNYQ